jgi:hypothetical protein
MLEETMQQLDCRATFPTSWYTFDSDDKRTTYREPILILSGSAETDSNGECIIPLYGNELDWPLLPRFYPPCGWPNSWGVALPENVSLLFADQVHLLASAATLGRSVETGFGLPIIMNFSVVSHYPAFDTTDFTISTQKLEPDSPIVYQENGLVGQMPVLYFWSFDISGKKQPYITFCWQLQGELIKERMVPKEYSRFPEHLEQKVLSEAGES